MNSKKKFLFLVIITLLFGFRWVTNSESAITQVGQWGSGHYINVFIENSYAYCAAGSAGIDIIDISDQTNPVLVSNFTTSGYAN
ncbi:MAG: hypothetical protein GY730_00310, partial [bacterium]|nr:hypothetical protein [bacterium]